jgi:hypothetical protein
MHGMWGSLKKEHKSTTVFSSLSFVLLCSSDTKMAQPDKVMISYNWGSQSFAISSSLLHSLFISYWPLFYVPFHFHVLLSLPFSLYTAPRRTLDLLPQYFLCALFALVLIYSYRKTEDNIHFSLKTSPLTSKDRHLHQIEPGRIPSLDGRVTRRWNETRHHRRNDRG